MSSWMLPAVWLWSASHLPSQIPPLADILASSFFTNKCGNMNPETLFRSNYQKIQTIKNRNDLPDDPDQLSHFTDEETEAQKSEEICPRSPQTTGIKDNQAQKPCHLLTQVQFSSQHAIPNHFCTPI